eukprot:TRINITY_DN2089_c1_g1_i5.p1 TRINITY_DN2089_c1_g1~~TRINITY_DN2089_c1_g1_i5.p1  ORF type:complete len:579 (-),score=145.85 TRINITY_DN2089_c1_g1_i5:127-1671(-)
MKEYLREKGVSDVRSSERRVPVPPSANNSDHGVASVSSATSDAGRRAAEDHKSKKNKKEKEKKKKYKKKHKSVSTPSQNASAATAAPSAPTVSKHVPRDVPQTEEEKRNACAVCGKKCFRESEDAIKCAGCGYYYHAARCLDIPLKTLRRIRQLERGIDRRPRTPAADVHGDGSVVSAEFPGQTPDGSLGDSSEAAGTSSASAPSATPTPTPDPAAEASAAEASAESDAVASPSKRIPWHCVDCKTCCVCEKAGDDEKLLLCDCCDRGYHTYCLKPPLTRAPAGTFICNACVRCLSCGSTSPGMYSNSRWQAEYSLCQDCFKAKQKNRYCTVCQTACQLRAPDVLRCVSCRIWIHVGCDAKVRGLTEVKRPENAQAFKCKMCEHKEEPPRSAKSSRMRRSVAKDKGGPHGEQEAAEDEGGTDVKGGENEKAGERGKEATAVTAGEGENPAEGGEQPTEQATDAMETALAPTAPNSSAPAPAPAPAPEAVGEAASLGKRAASKDALHSPSKRQRR